MTKQPFWGISPIMQCHFGSSHGLAISCFSFCRSPEQGKMSPVVQFKIFYEDNFERCKMHRMKKRKVWTNYLSGIRLWSVKKQPKGITWSVFYKPQSHKNVITWPEFLNRRLKPTVREAGRKKVLLHGRLRRIVCLSLILRMLLVIQYLQWFVQVIRELAFYEEQLKHFLIFYKNLHCYLHKINLYWFWS